MLGSMQNSRDSGDEEGEITETTSAPEQASHERSDSSEPKSARSSNGRSPQQYGSYYHHKHGAHTADMMIPSNSSSGRRLRKGPAGDFSPAPLSAGSRSSRSELGGQNAGFVANDGSALKGYANYAKIPASPGPISAAGNPSQGANHPPSTSGGANISTKSKSHLSSMGNQHGVTGSGAKQRRVPSSRAGYLVSASSHPSSTAPNSSKLPYGMYVGNANTTVKPSPSNSGNEHMGTSTTRINYGSFVSSNSSRARRGLPAGERSQSPTRASANQRSGDDGYFPPHGNRQGHPQQIGNLHRAASTGTLSPTSGGGREELGDRPAFPAQEGFINRDAGNILEGSNSREGAGPRGLPGTHEGSGSDERFTHREVFASRTYRSRESFNKREGFSAYLEPTSDPPPKGYAMWVSGTSNRPSSASQRTSENSTSVGPSPTYRGGAEHSGPPNRHAQGSHRSLEFSKSYNSASYYRTNVEQAVSPNRQSFSGPRQGQSLASQRAVERKASHSPVPPYRSDSDHAGDPKQETSTPISSRRTRRGAGPQSFGPVTADPESVLAHGDKPGFGTPRPCTHQVQDQLEVAQDNNAENDVMRQADARPESRDEDRESILGVPARGHDVKQGDGSSNQRGTPRRDLRFYSRQNSEGRIAPRLRDGSGETVGGRFSYASLARPAAEPDRIRGYAGHVNPKPVLSGGRIKRVKSESFSGNRRNWAPKSQPNFAQFVQNRGASGSDNDLRSEGFASYVNFGARPSLASGGQELSREASSLRARDLSIERDAQSDGIRGLEPQNRLENGIGDQWGSRRALNDISAPSGNADAPVKGQGRGNKLADPKNPSSTIGSIREDSGAKSRWGPPSLAQSATESTELDQEKSKLHGEALVQDSSGKDILSSASRGSSSISFDFSSNPMALSSSDPIHSSFNLSLGLEGLPLHPATNPLAPTAEGGEMTTASSVEEKPVTLGGGLLWGKGLTAKKKEDIPKDSGESGAEDVIKGATSNVPDHEKSMLPNDSSEKANDCKAESPSENFKTETTDKTFVHSKEEARDDVGNVAVATVEKLSNIVVDKPSTSVAASSPDAAPNDREGALQIASPAPETQSGTRAKSKRGKSGGKIARATGSKAKKNDLRSSQSRSSDDGQIIGTESAKEPSAEAEDLILHTGMLRTFSRKAVLDYAPTLASLPLEKRAKIIRALRTLKNTLLGSYETLSKVTNLGEANAMDARSVHRQDPEDLACGERVAKVFAGVCSALTGNNGKNSPDQLASTPLPSRVAIIRGINILDLHITKKMTTLEDAQQTARLARILLPCEQNDELAKSKEQNFAALWSMPSPGELANRIALANRRRAELAQCKFATAMLKAFPSSEGSSALYSCPEEAIEAYKQHARAPTSSATRTARIAKIIAEKSRRRRQKWKSMHNDFESQKSLWKDHVATRMAIVQQQMGREKFARSCNSRYSRMDDSGEGSRRRRSIDPYLNGSLSHESLPVSGRPTRVARQATNDSYVRTDYEFQLMVNEMSQGEEVRDRLARGGVPPTPMLSSHSMGEAMIDFDFVNFAENRNTTDGAPMLCAQVPLGEKCPLGNRCNCLRAMQVEQMRSTVWTDLEKVIFLDQFCMHPKDFRKIASALKNKTTKDCVAFYYNSKKHIDYKRVLREHQGNRRGGNATWVATFDALRSVGAGATTDGFGGITFWLPRSERTCSTLQNHPPAPPGLEGHSMGAQAFRGALATGHPQFSWFGDHRLLFNVAQYAIRLRPLSRQKREETLSRLAISGNRIVEAIRAVEEGASFPKPLLAHCFVAVEPARDQHISQPRRSPHLQAPIQDSNSSVDDEEDCQSSASKKRKTKEDAKKAGKKRRFEGSVGLGHESDARTLSQEPSPNMAFTGVYELLQQPSSLMDANASAYQYGDTSPMSIAGTTGQFQRGTQMNVLNGVPTAFAQQQSMIGPTPGKAGGQEAAAPTLSTWSRRNRQMKWTGEEKSRFVQLFREHGRDWQRIANEFPDKTASQMKNFYQNYKTKLNLTNILEERGEPTRLRSASKGSKHVQPADIRNSGVESSKASIVVSRVATVERPQVDEAFAGQKIHLPEGSRLTLVPPSGASLGSLTVESNPDLQNNQARIVARAHPTQAFHAPQGVTSNVLNLYGNAFTENISKNLALSSSVGRNPLGFANTSLLNPDFTKEAHAPKSQFSLQQSQIQNPHLQTGVIAGSSTSSEMQPTNRQGMQGNSMKPTASFGQGAGSAAGSGRGLGLGGQAVHAASFPLTYQKPNMKWGGSSTADDALSKTPNVQDTATLPSVSGADVGRMSQINDQGIQSSHVVKMSNPAGNVLVYRAIDSLKSTTGDARGIGEYADLHAGEKRRTEIGVVDERALQAAGLRIASSALTAKNGSEELHVAAESGDRRLRMEANAQILSTKTDVESEFLNPTVGEVPQLLISDGSDINSAEFSPKQVKETCEQAAISQEPGSAAAAGEDRDFGQLISQNCDNDKPLNRNPSSDRAVPGENVPFEESQYAASPEVVKGAGGTHHPELMIPTPYKGSSEQPLQTSDV